MGAGLPDWAHSILRCPRTGQAVRPEGDALVLPAGSRIGRIEQGIARMGTIAEDGGIAYYRAIGGTRFHERAAVPFAMSALDTPVYRGYLDNVRPADRDGLIIDVGGGDGRNTRPWLELGYRRVVIVDPVAEALTRFRNRVADEAPEWLDRLLCIEADARSIPIVPEAARCVLAIESLYYLNEDYETGLRECVRLLAPSGRLLLSERDYEGGLVLRLLYQGVSGMLESAGTRSLADGRPDAPVRTRCFTQAELVALLEAHGLTVVAVAGTSLLALLLGWLKGRQMIAEAEQAHLAQVSALLRDLGRSGTMRRCHVVVARRDG